MPSDLPSILNTIGNMAVLCHGEYVTGREGDDLPNALNTADLPLRMVLAGEPDEAGAEAVAVGWQQVRWTVHDIMIYKPVNLGSGRKEFKPVLHEYASNYLNTVGKARTVGVGRFIETIATDVADIEYPGGSGDMYNGVIVTLVVSEVFK